MNRKNSKAIRITRDLKTKQEKVSTRKSRDSEARSPPMTLIIDTDDKDNESDKPLSSIVLLPEEIDSPSNSTQSFTIRQCFNVYQGMSDDEWVKIRDAFIAAYFKEQNKNRLFY